jgi:hypothetical protein
MQSIHPNLFVVGLLINFLLVRLAAFFLPDEFYFSFTAFLFDNESLVRPAALFGKLAIPTIAGFLVVGTLAYIRSLERGIMGRSSRVQKVLADQAAITMAFAAMVLSMMMAWPYIILWDLLIDPEFSQHRLVYLIAYLAYFVASAFFALAGANTAIALFAPVPDDEKVPLTLATMKDHPMVKPVWDAVSGVAAAALAAFMGAQVG